MRELPKILKIIDCTTQCSSLAICNSTRLIEFFGGREAQLELNEIETNIDLAYAYLKVAHDLIEKSIGAQTPDIGDSVKMFIAMIPLMTLEDLLHEYAIALRNIRMPPTQFKRGDIVHRECVAVIKAIAAELLRKGLKS